MNGKGTFSALTASSCRDANGIFSQELVRGPRAEPSTLSLSCHCYSTLFSWRTHRCYTEWGSKEKRVWSWPVALHFGEWEGKGEFSMVLCNPWGSWVTQQLPRLRQQTPRGCEAGQLCPGKNNASAVRQRPLSFFQGLLQSDGKDPGGTSKGFQPHERAGAGSYFYANPSWEPQLPRKVLWVGTGAWPSCWGHIHPHRVFKS